jgi:fumarylacetoacetase
MKIDRMSTPSFLVPEKSWIEISPDSDFSLHNLPYGVARLPKGETAVVVAVGDYVLNLSRLYKKGFFPELKAKRNPFRGHSLNVFIALGRPAWTYVRHRLLALLNSKNQELQSQKDVSKVLIPQSLLAFLLPVEISNYTDFYSSMEHASNVGKMFRPDGEALLPNWKHIPVGYHGRASSIVVSGYPIRRPKGQTLPEGAQVPVFGPSRLLDFELEMAFVVGKSNALGESVLVDEAEEHVFGMVLFNDWSARDIQKWEYVPLGPFLAKNFASSMSPWVVTMDALQPFRTEAPVQDTEVLPYLKEKKRGTYDIQLFVDIQAGALPPATVCRSNFKYLYWTMAQQLAHHTVGGCNMQIGDVCASGTISGPSPDSFGSMLELSWKGSKPLQFGEGVERGFLQDGDVVEMRAFCEKPGVRVGFGSVKTEILPSI